MTSTITHTGVIARERIEPPSPVWEKLWSREIPAERDDALLARERHSPRWALIVETLTRVFGRVAGLRTIELGSGRGDLSALFAEQGADVTLVDTNERALTAARQRFDRLNLSAKYLSGDLLNLDAKLLNEFDVAISIGVVEHFKHDERTVALRAHHDVLKPGGLAIISVPNAWCPPYRLWKKYLDLRNCWPYGMEIPYSRRELARRAAAAGLTDIAIHGLGFYQSLSDQWARNVFHRDVDWMHYRSLFDNQLGHMLLMFARRDCRRTDLHAASTAHYSNQLKYDLPKQSPLHKQRNPHQNRDREGAALTSERCDSLPDTSRPTTHQMGGGNSTHD